jgi:hypothetical protein
LHVAAECLWKFAKTEGADDDTAPAKTGAYLIAQAILDLRHLASREG